MIATWQAQQMLGLLKKNCQENQDRRLEKIARFDTRVSQHRSAYKGANMQSDLHFIQPIWTGFTSTKPGIQGSAKRMNHFENLYD